VQALKAAQVGGSQDFYSVEKWRWQGCQPYLLAAFNSHFFYRLSRPQHPSVTGRLKSIKNVNDPVGNWTRDLPACSAVSQPNAPPPAHYCCTCVFWLSVLLSYSQISACWSSYGDRILSLESMELFECLVIFRWGVPLCF
jgi:hypothetical protein